MAKHFRYLRYLILHKWFVFVACRKCGVSLWRSIIHDWHKFLPSEWFGYTEFFYGDWKKLKESEPDDFRYWQVKGPVDAAFDHAWNAHQKRARHHWQFWLLTLDSGETRPLQIPDKFLREMVADWWGAGRVITGKWDAETWYYKNKTQMNLFPKTRDQVEEFLKQVKNKFNTPEMIQQRIRILGY